MFHVVNVSFLAGQVVLIVTASCGWIVVAVSIVTATCLLKVKFNS